MESYRRVFEVRKQCGDLFGDDIEKTMPEKLASVTAPQGIAEKENSLVNL
jgi:hypothetical protein